MATWPSNLQPRLLAGGFNLSPKDTVIRTQMDFGVAKTRRRFTTSTTDIPASIHLRDDQYTVFMNFFNNTVAGGALPFDYIHPVTGEPIRVRFRGPPKIDALGGKVYVVQMQWEILP